MLLDKVSKIMEYKEKDAKIVDFTEPILSMADYTKMNKNQDDSQNS